LVALPSPGCLSSSFEDPIIPVLDRFILSARFAAGEP
jgi:hypothetical protein